MAMHFRGRELAQQLGQLTAFGEREGREEDPLLDVVDDPVECLQPRAARLGHRDDVAPPVGGVHVARGTKLSPSSSPSSVTMSLRSMLVARERSAWLAGPDSSSAASRR